MPNQAACLVLLVAGITLVGCKGKSSEGDPMRGKEPPPFEVLPPPGTPPAGMDGEPRPSASRESAPRAATDRSAPRDASPRLKEALALLDDLLVKQKEMIAFVKGIKTLADLKAKQAGLAKRNLELMQASVNSMRKASMLQQADLAAFMGRNRQMRAESGALRVEMKRRKEDLGKIPGAEPILKRLEAESRKQTKPLMQEMSELVKHIAERFR